MQTCIAHMYAKPCHRMPHAHIAHTTQDIMLMAMMIMVTMATVNLKNTIVPTFMLML